MRLFRPTERRELLCEKVEQMPNGRQESSSGGKECVHHLAARHPPRHHFHQASIEQIRTNHGGRKLRDADAFEGGEPQRHHVFCNEAGIMRDERGSAVRSLQTPLMASSRRSHVDAGQFAQIHRGGDGRAAFE